MNCRFSVNIATVNMHLLYTNYNSRQNIYYFKLYIQGASSKSGQIEQFL